MTSSPPARAQLKAQIQCLSTDGKVVLVVQQWTDPLPPRGRVTSWLRLIRNGKVRDNIKFAGPAAQVEMQQAWDHWSQRYAATALTEEQMWEQLRELAKVEQVQCTAASKCAGRLPLGWHHCPDCGCDQRNVGRGGMSGVRGRMVMLDLRKRI